MYGAPIISASSGAVARAQGVQGSQSMADAEATAQALKRAIEANGLPVTVTPRVMDGTTLHQIVMGENNGLPPTPDQFKTDPSEWMIVNFQLDDMVSRADSPGQGEAAEQFARDLAVFVQRAAVAGKRVSAVMPMMTCDAPTGFTAANALIAALTMAANNSSLGIVGGIGSPLCDVDRDGKVTPGIDFEHLGADLRTPDAYLLNEQIQSIANAIAPKPAATK